VPSALGIPRLIYTGDFEPLAWLRAIEEEQITFVGAAPTAYRRLMAAARHRPVAASIRAASSSGEPLDAETAEAWRSATGTPLRDAYGLSELGMVLANLGQPETPIIPGGLAGAVPGFDVELVDDAGELIAEPGVTGTIAVARPPFPFAIDYLNAPEEWHRRWVNGRFRTGDLASRGEDGTFFFAGRSDDVIVTSGYNVGPAEVESVLLEHPGVADAAAVAGIDGVRGVVVRAVIVSSEGTVPGDKLTAELRRSVRERIGRHAEPRLVDFVDDLPRTETGKLRRVALRKRTP
jgi:acetyl-CoA synthetase